MVVFVSRLRHREFTHESTELMKKRLLHTCDFGLHAVVVPISCGKSMEPCFVKNYRDFELSFLGILVFRGTFGSIRPNFDPVSTNSDLFQTILPGGPDLLSSTYFDLFLPGGPDLFSPIWTYFVSQ